MLSTVFNGEIWEAKHSDDMYTWNRFLMNYTWNEFKCLSLISRFPPLQKKLLPSFSQWFKDSWLSHSLWSTSHVSTRRLRSKTMTTMTLTRMREWKLTSQGEEHIIISLESNHMTIMTLTRMMSSAASYLKSVPHWDLITAS
jgi:hypothetical protein